MLHIPLTSWWFNETIQIQIHITITIIITMHLVQ